jgi:hypothetical protein
MRREMLDRGSLERRPGIRVRARTHGGALRGEALQEIAVVLLALAPRVGPDQRRQRRQADYEPDRELEPSPESLAHPVRCLRSAQIDVVCDRQCEDSLVSAQCKSKLGAVRRAAQHFSRCAARHKVRTNRLLSRRLARVSELRRRSCQDGGDARHSSRIENVSLTPRLGLHHDLLTKLGDHAEPTRSEFGGRRVPCLNGCRYLGLGHAP